MRIAIIGLGGIATKAYLPLLASWEGIELLLYGRKPEAVARHRAGYRLPNGTSDWAEMLRYRPHAAFVLTSSETHFEIASALLAAGVDVFVEKPATLHSEQTEELGDRARQA